MARLKSKSKPGETPLEMGFRMPAEWEPHEATWLAWPHERTDWPGKFAPVPWVYADIVRILSRVERVRILVAGGKEKRLAQNALKKSGANLNAVDFYIVPTDRGWIRDFGPIFVKYDDYVKRDENVKRDAHKWGKGEIAITKWRFNAWAKYDNWKRDDAAVKKIAPRLNMQVWEAGQDARPIVLEGGSIDVNGRGTMLATEECLLSAEQARNPCLSREDIEKLFRDYLAVTNVLWLNRGIAGDDTHGHVDDLARFVDASTVVTVTEEDPSDVNYEPLQENLARLREMKDQDGRPLRIETLPMPQPVIFAGQRLPASYANFYIANSTVLVPTFNDPNDRVALDTLAALFPGRTVIGIACRDLVLGLGTLHCMTQQQPA
jgi:agmatine deiminase